MANTKQLTLIRHAKSDWSNSALTDFERELNARGERDAPEMGRRLKTSLAQPDLVLCSSAKRAQQTAKLLLPAMGVDLAIMQSVPQIYEASTNTLLKLIAATGNEICHLMLIGHNPGLADLCNRLLPRTIKSMPTCAISSFELASNSWTDPLDKANTLLMHDFPKNPG